MKKKNSINFISNFFVYFFPVILWMGVIFLFSSYPTKQVSHINWKDFFIKKTAHIIEYGILATLFFRAFKNNGMGKKEAGYLSVFLSFLYGLSDEIHQSFTPGREPTLRDVFFDTIGAMLFIYGIWYLLPKAKGRLKALARKLELI